MPDANSGLVSDCEMLLELRDELAGSAFLNWSPHIAVGSWDGVTVGGSTKRVTQIELDDKGLSGEIPAELGSLANLEVPIPRGQPTERGDTFGTWRSF